MKLAIIAIPVTDAPTVKTDPDGNEYSSFDPPARQEAWDVHAMQYHRIGVDFNGSFIMDCLMRESFVSASEATAENPATALPAGWLVAHSVRIHNQGRTTNTLSDLPDVVIPVEDIVDDVFNRTETHHRYYVTPQYDNADPENPVFLGVNVSNREYDSSVFYDDGVLNSDGSYTRSWTEPAKKIVKVAETTDPGFLVTPEELEGDGTYVSQQRLKTLDQAAFELLEPAHADLFNWMPEKLDEHGNPIQLFREDFTYGRMEATRFYTDGSAHTTGFSGGYL